MKKLTKIFAAVWVFSMGLWLLYMISPAAYYAMRANGAQWFTCVDWDANGQPYQSDQCDGPAPQFEPEQ